jgi:hypothetical protein
MCRPVRDDRPVGTVLTYRLGPVLLVEIDHFRVNNVLGTPAGTAGIGCGGLPVGPA